MQFTTTSNFKQGRFVAVWFLAILIAIATGCGSNTSQIPAPPAPGDDGGGTPVVFNSPPTTRTQVRFGDDPSEQILSCQLHIAYARLQSSTQGSRPADLMWNPSTVEFTRLAGTYEPAGIVDMPQGIYDHMVMHVDGANVTYVDPAGVVHSRYVNTQLTSTVSLDPVISIGDIPTILIVDVDISKTVKLGPGSNQVSLSGPVVVVTQENIAGPGGLPSGVHKRRDSVETPSSTQLGPQNGAVERLVGTASEVQDYQFTLEVGSSKFTLPMQFDDYTVFENTSSTTLDGMLVEVEGYTQPDGSIYCSEVEGLFPDTGVELEGILTSKTVNGSYLVVPQDGIGAGMASNLVGSSVTAKLDGAVSYSVNVGDDDMTGLMLVFDQDHVFGGQRVELESATGVIKSGTKGILPQIQPYKAELLHQTLSGTISNYAIGASGMPEFDLQLSRDSYLAIENSGTTSVHVYQRSTSDTSQLNNTAIEDGKSITVRGFLYGVDDNRNVTSGVPLHFAMVATSFSKLHD